MSKLERIILDQQGSSSEEDELPSFLKLNPNQGGRMTQSVKMDMVMQDAHEARQRDIGVKDRLGGCIVDQSQFRNVAVGEGYQHATVIRQATIQNDGAMKGKIVDKTAEGLKQRRLHKREKRAHTKCTDEVDSDRQTRKKKKEKKHKKSKKLKKKHHRHSDSHSDKESSPSTRQGAVAAAQSSPDTDPTSAIDALKEMRRLLVAAIARQRS